MLVSCSKQAGHQKAVNAIWPQWEWLVVQVKYIDADGINFGPQRHRMAALREADTAIRTLLDSDVYQSLADSEWNLRVELTAYICLPQDSGVLDIDFFIQVCPRLTHDHAPSC